MGDQINILEDIDINTPVDIEKKLTDILVKNNTIILHRTIYTRTHAHAHAHNFTNYI